MEVEYWQLIFIFFTTACAAAGGIRPCSSLCAPSQRVSDESHFIKNGSSSCSGLQHQQYLILLDHFLHTKERTSYSTFASSVLLLVSLCTSFFFFLPAHIYYIFCKRFSCPHRPRGMYFQRIWLTFYRKRRIKDIVVQSGVSVLVHYCVFVYLYIIDAAERPLVP